MHLDKVIHDLVLRAVVVGADVGKPVVTSVYAKDLSIRFPDLLKDLINNRDRSDTVDRNKNTVVLGRIGQQKYFEFLLVEPGRFKDIVDIHDMELNIVLPQSLANTFNELMCKVVVPRA